VNDPSQGALEQLFTLTIMLFSAPMLVSALPISPAFTATGDQSPSRRPPFPQPDGRCVFRFFSPSRSLFDSDSYLLRNSILSFGTCSQKSIIFVIKAVSVPLPSVPLSKIPPRKLKLCIPLNLATAPVIIVFILKAAQCIPWTVVRDGITGGTTGVQPFNIMILFFSLAYLAMSLGPFQDSRYSQQISLGSYKAPHFGSAIEEELPADGCSCTFT